MWVWMYVWSVVWYGYVFVSTGGGMSTCSYTDTCGEGWVRDVYQPYR